MKLDREQVLERFLTYCGEDPLQAGEARQALWEALCHQCAQWVETAAGPRADQWEEALISLAAAKAFYQLTLTDGALAPEALTAGEVKIDWAGREQKARALAEEQQRLCGPALLSQEFYCKGV